MSASTPPKVEATPEWFAYEAAPTGPKLGALLAVFPLPSRTTLVEAIEQLFFDRQDWRVAQHAAMLHLDRFEPHAEQPDLVKALCFAEYACSLSNDDPRARLAMGRVNWERRLALGVLFDVERVHAGEARLRLETSDAIVEKVLGEAFLLEGMARAYLRDIDRAHESLIQAERRGSLTVAAVAQLLMAAEPDFPDVSIWCLRCIPHGCDLGGRAGTFQLHASRRELLALLRRRADNVPSRT